MNYGRCVFIMPGFFRVRRERREHRRREELQGQIEGDANQSKQCSLSLFLFLATTGCLNFHVISYTDRDSVSVNTVWKRIVSWSIRSSLHENQPTTHSSNCLTKPECATVPPAYRCTAQSFPSSNLEIKSKLNLLLLYPTSSIKLPFKPLFILFALCKAISHYNGSICVILRFEQITEETLESLVVLGHCLTSRGICLHLCDEIICFTITCTLRETLW